MTIVSEAIDPLWRHEELLTIKLLSHGSCHRNELKKQIRKTQEKATFPPHSETAYAYWFRALKNRGIATEEDKILSLTNLGHWVASGSVGTLPIRNLFIYLTCDKCSNDTQIVIRTPLMKTLTSNSKDDPFVDIICPCCSSLSRQHNLGGIASRVEIADFYNHALTDLKKFVPVVIGKAVNLEYER